MSALDTYEWFVSTSIKNRSENILRVMSEQRAYLFSLRSEDERQRFVEAAMDELRMLARHTRTV